MPVRREVVVDVDRVVAGLESLEGGPERDDPALRVAAVVAVEVAVRHARSVLAHRSRFTLARPGDGRRDQPEADEHRRKDEARIDPVASRHDRLPDKSEKRSLGPSRVTCRVAQRSHSVDPGCHLTSAEVSDGWCAPRFRVVVAHRCAGRDAWSQTCMPKTGSTCRSHIAAVRPQAAVERGRGRLGSTRRLRRRAPLPSSQYGSRRPILAIMGSSVGVPGTAMVAHGGYR